MRLGAEHQHAAALEEIERLLPETIAREMEPSAARLVEGEGEHAVDLFERRAHAVALQHAEQHLGVGSIDEIRARVRELGCQRRKAVDLSVEDERVAGGRIDARLVTAVEIDDCEPQVSECDPPIDVDVAFVGPAMGDRSEHAAQDRRIDGGRVPSNPG